MKRPLKMTLVLGACALVANFFVNCSDVAFNQSSGGDPSQSANGAGGGTTPSGDGNGVDGTIGQDGGGGTGGTGTGTGGTGTGGTGTGGTGTGMGGTGPVTNPPGGTTPPGGTVDPGTPLAPANIIPLVRFIGPPCVRGTNCLVAFELDQAYQNRVDFDWLTNDTIWMTPNDPIYGKPNYHYVPTSGHITFMPGEIRKEVYVQNINPDNVSILIGIRMRMCTYGGLSYNCTQFFR